MVLRVGELCDPRAARRLLVLSEVSGAGNSHRGYEVARCAAVVAPTLSGDKNSAGEIAPAFHLYKSVHCLMVAAHSPCRCIFGGVPVSQAGRWIRASADVHRDLAVLVYCVVEWACSITSKSFAVGKPSQS